MDENLARDIFTTIHDRLENFSFLTLTDIEIGVGSFVGDFFLPYEQMEELLQERGYNFNSEYNNTPRENIHTLYYRVTPKVKHTGLSIPIDTHTFTLRTRQSEDFERRYHDFITRLLRFWVVYNARRLERDFFLQNTLFHFDLVSFLSKDLGGLLTFLGRVEVELDTTLGVKTLEVVITKPNILEKKMFSLNIREHEFREHQGFFHLISELLNIIVFDYYEQYQTFSLPSIL